LTIEKLKAQIAKFRHEKLGASSEGIDRVIAQLALALVSDISTCETDLAA
jgi:hypothetical protein